MKKPTVINLHKSHLIRDINNGLTWFEKDNLGFGSIEKKYDLTPGQVENIMKHPLVQDIEIPEKIIRIIDDTDQKQEIVLDETQDESEEETSTEEFFKL